MLEESESAAARASPAGGAVDPGLQSPLLSHFQLVDLASSLAASHKSLSAKRRGRPLLRHLRRSARRLTTAYRAIALAAGRREPLTAAAEWLFDNFHIVEEQLADIWLHLPRTYYAELPKLLTGPLVGFPRVYALARALISHADGALDEHALRECLVEYQRTSPLSSGELWAVPIMLRVGLIEYLERLAAPLETRRRARLEADEWADRLAEAAADRPGSIVVLLGRLAERRGTLTGPHLVRLYQRLRGRGPAMAPVLAWLTSRVAVVAGCEVDDFIRLETHLQAAVQVSIRNTITSFRLLDRISWNEFFDATSVVEAALREDPAYAASAFRTRDACRHSVERIARRAEIPETRVAETAVRLAQTARARISTAVAEPDHASGGRQPGPAAEETAPYYLIDDGTPDLEATLDYSSTVREWLFRLVRRRAAFFYMGGIGGIGLLLMGAALAYAASHGANWGMLLLTALAALIPVTELAVALVNGHFTRWLTPKVLAKQDYRGGIPPDRRTLVVIPALLTSAERVDALLENLEIHYLANWDANLHFALLTDFTDATHETESSDDALLDRVFQGILGLNERYEGPITGRAPNQRFFLFHRRRRWNEIQQCWMGWERKRGKLMELNRLLRGDETTSFSVTVGDRSALRDVRYVLTLDSDTRLPLGAARRLVEIISHPLNTAVVDEERRCVIRGYGIIQPRVSITLTSAARSVFTRVFSGNAGVDPYTTATSDVYQDLFGQGVFCGKGLYDIDVFERVLRGRVAENTLLSHDLFEGAFARCALATDVEVFDDYPLRYDSFSARQHRWMRGDWQLLRWLLRSVQQPADSSGANRRTPNPLSLLSQWQIMDNVRRSLVAPGVLLLLSAGWLVLPGEPAVWTLVGLCGVAVPILAHLAAVALMAPQLTAWRSCGRSVVVDLWMILKQVGLSLCFLAHQAVLALDAVTRTLWRMFVRHLFMLEWQTAAESERRLGAGLPDFCRRMWPAVGISLLLFCGIAATHPTTLWMSTPVLLLWCLSPWIAYQVSLPVREEWALGGGETLTASERSMLRGVARRTWRFFEEVVTADDNHLPPDNYQADRADPLAHRTSPTNIGLLLLATVSARDFGYVGLLEFVDRLERTLTRLATLERHRGHFFNWYDTQLAIPILPFYISTVDSGNLAGHLLAVKQALLEVRHRRLFGPATLSGLRDTTDVLRAATLASNRKLRKGCDELNSLMGDTPAWCSEWDEKLQSLENSARSLDEPETRGHSAEAAASPEAVDALAWCRLLIRQLGELRHDHSTLMPWCGLLLVQPQPFGDGRPLTGELGDRPYVFRELIRPSAGAAQSLEAILLARNELLAELDRLRLTLSRASLEPGARERAGAWLDAVATALEQGLSQIDELLARVASLAALCNRLVRDMDFRFLYDEDRDLFSVGYDVSDARTDPSHYDLLASECRLASFVAIAKGDVPERHWFRMGRPLTGRYWERALISWGGTMFEYLMPHLVMRSCAGTLLACTLPAVVRLQQRFARREQVPWGMSESGFGARDPQLNYQYRTFGVPGLGLKPDLFEDLVVAPYATLLALPVAPRAAVRNLEALARAGLSCPYGFFEAIDYTPSRLAPGSHGEVVRELMAHHQGMALVSLGNTLLERGMPDRFHADPLVKAVELLLEERVPRSAATTHPGTQQVALARRAVRDVPPSVVRHYTTAQTSTPRVQLLSNRRYAVMLTAAGGGYSTWDGLAVTRWREDSTRDHWGQFIYIRDIRNGRLWSVAHQPTCPRGGEYDVFFTEDKAEFRRRLDGILAHVEVAVSAEDNAEVRRVTITNTTDTARELEVASYAEIVMASAASDRAHTSFSNLFVETEFVPESNALLATRRPRSGREPRVWAMHVLAHEGLPPGIWSETTYETERGRFLGRGRTPAAPASLSELTASRSI